MELTHWSKLGRLINRFFLNNFFCHHGLVLIFFKKIKSILVNSLPEFFSRINLDLVLTTIIEWIKELLSCHANILLISSYFSGQTSNKPLYYTWFLDSVSNLFSFFFPQIEFIYLKTFTIESSYSYPFTNYALNLCSCAKTKFHVLRWRISKI